MMNKNENKGLKYIKDILIQNLYNKSKYDYPKNYITIQLSGEQAFKIVNEIIEIEEKEKEEKYYIVYIRQYTIILNDYVVYKKYIKTNDIYHYIGKYYSKAFEKVERIDYQEITKDRYEEGKDITYYNGKELTLTNVK